MFSAYLPRRSCLQGWHRFSEVRSLWNRQEVGGSRKRIAGTVSLDQDCIFAFRATGPCIKTLMRFRPLRFVVDSTLRSVAESRAPY